jgi:hypothetical protein
VCLRRFDERDDEGDGSPRDRYSCSGIVGRNGQRPRTNLCLAAGQCTTGRPRITFFTLFTGRTLWSSFPFGTGRPNRAGWPLQTYSPLGTNRPSRPGRANFALELLYNFGTDLFDGRDQYFLGGVRAPCHRKQDGNGHSDIREINVPPHSRKDHEHSPNTSFLPNRAPTEPRGTSTIQASPALKRVRFLEQRRRQLRAPSSFSRLSQLSFSLSILMSSAVSICFT